MKRARKLLVVLPVAALVAAGCGGELSTREKGTFGGAALGAATGAIIGAAVGSPGAGAAIGAGVGALGGTMVGGGMQESERKSEVPARQQPPPPPPPGYGAAPPPPPPPQARVAPSGDPTRGQLENATRWKVQVYIDQDPSRLTSAPFFTLNPNDVVPQNLDIGTHRVIAQAFVETQFGTRPVGRFDRSIQVDPRGAGWSLRFSEGDFR